MIHLPPHREVLVVVQEIVRRIDGVLSRVARAEVLRELRDRRVRAHRVEVVIADRHQVRQDAVYGAHGAVGEDPLGIV